jgi:hypothetical protein
MPRITKARPPAEDTIADLEFGGTVKLVADKLRRWKSRHRTMRISRWLERSISALNPSIVEDAAPE